MKIEIDDDAIEKIAKRVTQMMREAGQVKPEDDEYVSTREAAHILSISPDRLRHLKHKFPHIKAGDNERGKLLFLKKGLLRSY